MINEENSKISVVILTFNEEANLPYALQSVKNWSDDIHVVDSGSTDDTINLARQGGVNVHYNPWINWAVQRNWALDNCSLRYDWVLFLDADELLTLESKQEIAQRTLTVPSECLGFYLKFHYYFLDKLVRNAMQPHLRLIRTRGVRWFTEGAREHCSAPSNSPVIKSPLIHYERRGIEFWSHNLVDKAKIEAIYQYQRKRKSKNTVVEEKYLFRHHIRKILFSFFPPFLRAIPVFTYRLLFKTDIRDGWAGLAHAFFFGLWYPMLIDAMYIELCYQEATKNQNSKSY